MTDALFTADGPAGDGIFVPSPLTTGPWSPGAQHGGPVAALCARAVERCGDDAESFALARLTVELLRPVPVAPLRVDASLSRPGRKVQLVAVSVSVADTGQEVVRATGLRLRRGQGERPPVAAGTPSVPPPPGEGVRQRAWAGDWTAFHRDGVEIRFVDGSFLEAGPATVWIRLTVPVVAGEEPSPAMRACAAADFGNGVSAVLPVAEWTFVNPDLTVSLLRPPVGEWICLDAHTVAGDGGGGIATSALFDETGLVGRATQTLFIEHR